MDVDADGRERTDAARADGRADADGRDSEDAKTGITVQEPTWSRTAYKRSTEDDNSSDSGVRDGPGTIARPQEAECTQVCGRVWRCLRGF